MGSAFIPESDWTGVDALVAQKGGSEIIEPVSK
jgi:hypothetical protein